MWGDPCLRHIPGVARTRSRGIPSGTGPASVRHGGDRVSRQCRSPLLCQRKSPDKPGTGWLLASVTHTWPRGSHGLLCAGFPHPHPRHHSPLAGGPGSAKARGGGTAGNGSECVSKRQPAGTGSSREVPCIPAPSSCRPPRKCHLRSGRPQRVTTFHFGFHEGVCKGLHVPVTYWGQPGGRCQQDRWLGRVV